MRGFIIAVLMLLCGVTAQAQAPSPAQMGVTPTTTPESLQVLDKNQGWVPIGTFPPGGPFVPTGGSASSVIPEVDILATDPSVGMVTNGSDNSPFVQNLMNKIGPPSSANNNNVVFPFISGQVNTEYYFSQPFVFSRGANFRCGGGATNSATYLVFAPGVDGVIQEASQFTADGGTGNGTLSNCNVISMGFGAATANPITPNTLTGVSFNSDPANLIPLPQWKVGDGILLTTTNNSLFPNEAIPAVPFGTMITAVGAMGGDGNPANQQNLTLSNPVSSSLGSAAGSHSTAVFTETGTNNFGNGDVINVAGVAYTFRTVLGTAVHSVLIGVDFPTSSANLVAATKNTAGQFVTYVPQNSGSAQDQYAPNLYVIASYANGVITFTSIYGGPVANTFVSTYTPAGTAAGSFGGATFTGANDATTCPAPCPAANVATQFYQLPGSQAFKVQTTIGSNNITIISGPRVPQPGDLVSSDAFPLGALFYTVTGTTFPLTATIGTALSGATQNATVTHAAGAEGSLWILPTANKRRTTAAARNNNFAGWPVGQELPCNSTWSSCTGSIDENNVHQQNFIGRFSTGNAAYKNSATNEQFTSNYLMDVFDGVTYGGEYYNLNMYSPSVTSKWSYISYCYFYQSTIFGGWISGGGNACAPSGNIYPPVCCGNLIFGPTAGYNNGPTFGRTGGQFHGLQGYGFFFGNDGAGCVVIGGPPSNLQTMLAVSPNNCSSGNLGVSWDIVNQVYEWTVPNAQIGNAFMRTPLSGYIGTGAYASNGAIFPFGIGLAGDGSSNTFNNARYFGMANAKPAFYKHLQGDTVINTLAIPGSAMAWYDAPSFTTTLTEPVLVGTTGNFTATIGPASNAMAVSAFASGQACVGGTIAGTGVTGAPKIVSLPSGATHGCSNAIGTYTLSIATLTISTPTAMTASGQTAVAVTACPATALTATTISDTTAVPNTSLGLQLNCIAGTPNILTFNGVANTASAGSNDTIQFLQWYGTGLVSNSVTNPDYSMVALRSGSSANKDITGQLTLAGATPVASLTFSEIYASAPECTTQNQTNVTRLTAAVVTTTTLTLGNGVAGTLGIAGDVITYHCFGRN